MNILIWNCHQAFRRKCLAMDRFDFDIAVISECENPSLIDFPQEFISKYHHYWRGKSKHQGIGIFIKNAHSYELDHRLEQEDLQYIIPLTINYQHTALTLHAIWACQSNASTFSYIGQVWQYLDRNMAKIDFDNSIFAGDFNSNSIWDTHHPHGNHSDVVGILREGNVSSAYHSYYKEQQGRESVSTLYLQKNPAKGYHIDYCFLPNRLLPNVNKLQIGEHLDWLKYSDHMPIYLEIGL